LVNDTLDLMDEIAADAARDDESRGNEAPASDAKSYAALQREGVAAMNGLGDVKDFPAVFVDLARRTGLRLVLLKRWTSGLQVFLEENVTLPEEAKQKRRDGKAPIPTTEDDIFTVLGEDVAVYCGPVPMKHFPLDLTIMLGRGSRERRILVLPLPAGAHCNTFLYLDADADRGEALETAEFLAQYALNRMRLISSGSAGGGSRAATILATELERRKEDGSDGPAAERPEPAATESGGDQPEPTCVAGEPGTAEELPSVPAWDRQVREGGGLTPETIFEHSGELPALPKAACHIMAVIEDPGTTATKLEQALAMDQALTAKVLRIANSPFYGAVREITTVSEAIVRLGFVAIRNWTLVTAARSVFLSPGAGMLYQKIWRQSVLSAMAGQLVAQASGRANPEMVFVGGLMQNIGQLVLARSHPELFQEILTDSAQRNLPYHEVERDRLGFDHGELGALLIREWNLSPELEEAVRWHHSFADHAESPIAAMIALGEDIARCSSSGEELAEAEAGEAAELLGLAPDQVEELKTRAAELQIDPHFFN
jgi:HD-like signal output (HDOD) protein